MIDLIKEKVFDKFKDDPHRLAHILGVEAVAVKLSCIHGVDPNKARIAALYHDFMKNDPIDLQMSFLSAEEIKLYHDFPVMYHGLSAAVKLREDFQIDDAEILHAIRSHIFGKPQMSKLEKIIFIADYVEPNRVMEDIHQIYEIATKDLDEAVYRVLESTNHYLKEKGFNRAPEQIRSTHYYEEVTRGKVKHHY